MGFAEDYINESISILSAIDRADVEYLAEEISCIRAGGGRLFVLGVGGNAANASHAVNDFRHTCMLESYTPTDNSAELTARINNESWDSCFYFWLESSRLNSNDALLILSVGGGSPEKNISMNLVKAIDYAKGIQAKVFGIVGKETSYTKKMADACVVIPTLVEERITPHSEGIISVLLHLLFSHPDLKMHQTKWESIA